MQVSPPQAPVSFQHQSAAPTPTATRTPTTAVHPLSSVAVQRQDVLEKTAAKPLTFGSHLKQTRNNLSMTLSRENGPWVPVGSGEKAQEERASMVEAETSLKAITCSHCLFYNIYEATAKHTESEHTQIHWALRAQPSLHSNQGTRRKRCCRAERAYT